MPLTHLVVTSISAPNAVLRALAFGADANGWKFHLIGDRKSPEAFALDGCNHLSIDAQRELPFEYAKLCPENSYARKNLGYLLAMSEGAEAIVETDDDNFPLSGFWSDRQSKIRARLIQSKGWINAYRYFSDTFCYPRGFPLNLARTSWDDTPAAVVSEPLVCCPIQQGLANGQPDVDAVFRMLHPADIAFEPEESIAIGQGQWCPVNSQNTTWFPSVFPLLYLPATCSFRMTDIWRGLIAQRILQANGLLVGFHSATVRQERNIHDPMEDFEQELPGYRHNAEITDRLQNLSLQSGSESFSLNLEICYEALIRLGVIKMEEEMLLEAWLSYTRSLGV